MPVLRSLSIICLDPGFCVADLCEAEFEKLSEGEKAFFRAIRWPEDESDVDSDT